MDMRKMNYAECKDCFDAKVAEQELLRGYKADLEVVRQQMYGYTFTPEYARGEVPDIFSFKYWNNYFWDHNESYEGNEEYADYIADSPQECVLLKAMDTTGDGQTPETAISVIDVYQEYEYLNRVIPYSYLNVKSQSVQENGIDCIYFEPNMFGIECIYFDCSRRFEVGYNIGEDSPCPY